MTDHAGARAMWDERYGSEHYLYGVEPNAFLVANEPSLPQGRVLCLADGEGRNSVFLAATGRCVTSVELTEAGTTKARKLAAERDVVVDAIVADLADYDLGPGRWDVIVSIFAHMPPAIRARLHRRVVEALRPGGLFLLEAYTPEQIGRGTGGPSSAELMMTAEALRVELAPLEFLHLVETDREVVEGTAHTGVGSVVQVLARKSQ